MAIPSNSLASVYALMKDCAQNRVPGPDTEIEIEACEKKALCDQRREM
jgi:hypothetical protein